MIKYMNKSKVYFTKLITDDSVVEMFKILEKNYQEK